jgi:hypothetical protein
MRNHACRMRWSVRTRLLRDRTAARRPRRPRQRTVVLCVIEPSRNCSPRAIRHLGDGETVFRVFADCITRLGDWALIGVSNAGPGPADLPVGVAWSSPGLTRDGKVTTPVKPYIVTRPRAACGSPPAGHRYELLSLRG